MKIRKLTKDDVEEFWDLRFKALKEDGEAFAASYEEEINKPLQDLIFNFENNLIAPTTNKFVLGAFSNENKMIGVVGLYRETRMKLMHKATIWGMYVPSEYRNNRIGRELITELINIAKLMEGLEQLNLTVVTENIQAKKLYNTVGFITYGKEKNAIKIGDKYLDEDYMVYFVK